MFTEISVLKSSLDVLILSRIFSAKAGENRRQVIVTWHASPSFLYGCSKNDRGALDREVHSVVEICRTMKLDRMPTEAPFNLIDIAASEISDACSRIFGEECSYSSVTKRLAVSF